MLSSVYSAKSSFFIIRERISKSARSDEKTFLSVNDRISSTFSTSMLFPPLPPDTTVLPPPLPERTTVAPAG